MIVLALVAAFRSSTLKLAVVLVGTILFGVVARLVAGGIDDSWTAGPVEESGRLARWAADWVIVPGGARRVGRPASATSGSSRSCSLLTLIHGWWRIALLVPTLYLASFVWENVLLAHPESTRYIVIGAVLVAMMIARPQGLLGEKRVEIV